VLACDIIFRNSVVINVDDCGCQQAAGLLASALRMKICVASYRFAKAARASLYCSERERTVRGDYKLEEAHRLRRG
jgi:hypothetical protein